MIYVACFYIWNYMMLLFFKDHGSKRQCHDDDGHFGTLSVQISELNEYIGQYFYESQEDIECAKTTEKKLVKMFDHDMLTKITVLNQWKKCSQQNST